MYDVISLKCKAFEYSIVLATLDSRIISLLKPKIPTDALSVVQSVFLSSHSARVKSISRADLLASVEAVLDVVEDEGDKLCYVYSVDVKSGPLASSGTGAISGIRMPDDESHYYSLTGGAGICELQKWGIDQTGRGCLIQTTDCREKSSLLSENTGEIKIKKRKVKLTLPGLLQDLKTKLIELDCKELSLSYKESPVHP